MKLVPAARLQAARKTAGIQCDTCVYRDTCGSCIRSEPRLTAEIYDGRPQPQRDDACGNWRGFDDATGHYVLYLEVLLDELRRQKREPEKA